jgi:AcrR family transcriptional regulator
VIVSEPPPPRRRNAAATRQAILDSARRAFARAGYDGVGVREIAHDAGVTAMLVNRYFGSKERLFAEVSASIMATPNILTADTLNSPDLAGRLAAGVVEVTEAGATPLDGFLISLYSMASERAAEIGREQLEGHYHRVLTAALTGDRAPQRAALILALVAGVQVMRQMVGLSALADATPDELVELLTPLFDQLVSGAAAVGGGAA